MTGYSPRKEYVLFLNDHNFGQLKTKFNGRHILMLFCKASSSKCQNLVTGYLTAAYVFRVIICFLVHCSTPPVHCSSMSTVLTIIAFANSTIFPSILHSVTSHLDLMIRWMMDSRVFVARTLSGT